MRTVGAALGLIVVTATTAAGASLVATAGLGGLARPGRWAPVHVTVTNTDARLACDLVVSWGDATVRRRVVFESPGIRQIDLHIRTTNVESQLQVRFEGGGDEPAVLTVPIGIVRDDQRFILCIADDPGVPSTEAECTASVRAAALPVSPRGYEAVDLVSWPLGRARLTPEQAAALTQWEALKRLDASGDLSLTPQAARPSLARGLPAGTRRDLLLTALAYGGGLTLVSLVCTRRAVRLSWAAAGVCLAVVLGSATMAALGQIGPARAVTIHYGSVLQQIPGTSAALLSMRAIAEFPARETTMLQLPVVDGVIEGAVPRGRADERQDADGFPTFESRVGLGARRAFGAEAVVQASLLRVDERAGVLRITNLSPHVLKSCRLASGVQPSTVDALLPGGVIEATRPGGDEAGVLGPLVLCSTDAAAVPLTAAGRPVTMQGTTIVAAYLARLPAPAGQGEP